jgi:DNA invertase Pin-like site-specific DNA recombinase
MAAGLKSTEQQLDEIKKFAALRGWRLDDQYVFVDDEVSGEEWVKRPGYQKLRAALVKPPFKHLIVWEQSRFGRDTARQLMAITEVTEVGVEVWSVKDARQLAPRDVHTVISAWKGEEDNAETRDRVNRAHEARFNQGLVTGGPCSASGTSASTASTRPCGASATPSRRPSWSRSSSWPRRAGARRGSPSTSRRPA